MESKDGGNKDGSKDGGDSHIPKTPDIDESELVKDPAAGGAKA